METKDLRIVVFGSKAADPASRTGGTIANYVKSGSKATIVVLSLGELGEASALYAQDTPLEEIKKIKLKESEEAAKILGADFRYLGFDPRPLLLDKEKEYVLANLIRELKPDIILTHPLNDFYNPDHATTGKSIVRAASFAGAGGLKLRFPPHRTRAIYNFIPSAGQSVRVGFKPDVYIDITDVIDIKMEAIKCFKSQEFRPWMVDYYTTEARRRGHEAHGGVKYAEAFTTFYNYRPMKLFPW